MKNITEYINESRFKGHDYYRDGSNLVEDDKTIGSILDDGTVEFLSSCKLSEQDKIQLLKTVTHKSPDLNGLYYNDNYFEDGKMSKA